MSPETLLAAWRENADKGLSTTWGAERSLEILDYVAGIAERVAAELEQVRASRDFDRVEVDRLRRELTAAQVRIAELELTARTVIS